MGGQTGQHTTDVHEYQQAPGYLPPQQLERSGQAWGNRSRDLSLSLDTVRPRLTAEDHSVRNLTRVQVARKELASPFSYGHQVFSNVVISD